MKNEDRWEVLNAPILSPGMVGYEEGAFQVLFANQQHMFERIQDLEAVTDRLGGLAELGGYAPSPD